MSSNGSVAFFELTYLGFYLSDPLVDLSLPGLCLIQLSQRLLGKIEKLQFRFNVRIRVGSLELGRWHELALRVGTMNLYIISLFYEDIQDG
jgi:hypothetical protein